MIALDASVLIGYFDRQDALHDRAEAALLAHAQERLCASVMTLAEIFVGPIRRNAMAPAGEIVAALEVAPVELQADGDLVLADLRARTGLKLEDCCVLMAAQEMHASILSFDRRLVRAAQGEGIQIVS